MARIRVGASARVPFTPVRVGASVPVTPSSKTVFRVGPVICGILAVVALAAWPLLVFHTTTYTRSCQMGGFGIPDCTRTAHDHITSLGWTVEWAWLLVLVLVGKRVFRKNRPAAQPPTDSSAAAS